MKSLSNFFKVFSRKSLAKLLRINLSEIPKGSGLVVEQVKETIGSEKVKIIHQEGSTGLPWNNPSPCTIPVESAIEHLIALTGDAPVDVITVEQTSRKKFTITAIDESKTFGPWSIKITRAAA